MTRSWLASLAHRSDPLYVSDTAARAPDADAVHLRDAMTETANLMTSLAPTLSDIAEYRGRVMEARINRSGEVLFNSSTAHATVLIEQLFEAAERDVRIVCRTLNPTSYGSPEVIAAAERFLSRPGASLQVMVALIEDGEANPFYAAFNGAAGVSILQTDVPFAFDFMEADATAYRFEEDADVSAATASFNDPAFAGQLAALFTLASPVVPQPAA